MSTFEGIFEEFEFISADRFNGVNLQSKVFFLSHCHTDHMIGLNNYTILPGPLYTSEISALFLRKRFPKLENIKILDIDIPVEISYNVEDESYKIVVTAYPAHHCPGSIMLLIQSKERKILYTGDFRLTKTALEKYMKPLYESFPDAVYLDSTFLNKTYMEFPTQMSSIRTICEIIDNWISKGSNYKVKIEIPALYGSEFLFIGIGNKLKKKIYFKSNETYAYFPDMDLCVSKNPENCQIYACLKPQIRFNTTIDEISDDNILYRIIRPSAMIWRNWNSNQKLFIEQNGILKVAYSNHSSYTEIKEFLEFIKPKNIKLNVLPSNKYELNQMKQALEEIYPKIDCDKISSSSVISTKFNNLFTFARITESTHVLAKLPPKRLKLTKE